MPQIIYVIDKYLFLLVGPNLLYPVGLSERASISVEVLAEDGSFDLEPPSCF